MTITQQRPRVAILAGALGRGGIAVIVRDHCMRWVAAGVDVSLVVERGDSPFAADIPRGVAVTELADLHPTWGVPRLLVWLLRTRPQAVVVHRPRLLRPLYRAMALSGVRPRVIGVLHSMLSSRIVSGAVQRNRAESANLARCDALVATSRGLARDAAAVLGVRPDSVAIAYPPICVEALRTRAVETPWAPALHVSPREYFVAAGRLEGVKDFPTLFRAFARVAPRYPELDLVVLGEGAEFAALRELASTLGIAGRAHLAGFAINPYPWIAGARALVLSSLHEGFGIVIAEALALRVPVISTDCPAGPAEILEDGRHGRLVPVGDPAALAEAMLASLAEPLRATPAAVARFDPAASSAVYLRVLGLP